MLLEAIELPMRDGGVAFMVVEKGNRARGRVGLLLWPSIRKKSRLPISQC
jgi:hypothetical protein